MIQYNAVRGRTKYSGIVSPKLSTEQKYLTLHLDGIANTLSGHDSEATTWEDLTEINSDAALAAGSAVWGDNYLRLDGSSYWNVTAAVARGTLEVVVSIDSDFSPVSTSAWYAASCICGTELASTQQDYGIIINSSKKFAVGYARDSIWASSVNACDGYPHTLSYSYLHGPIQFAIDGVIVLEGSATCSGTQLSYLGIGWNRAASATKVKGNIYGIKFTKSVFNEDDIARNHQINKRRFGF